MKVSRFNIEVYEPSTRRHLIFNTLTKALVAFSEADYANVRRLLCSESTEDSDAIARLASLGFLVEDGLDESAAVVRRQMLGTADPNRLDVIVMPNMNCNLSCTYCYERHESSEMSEDTEARLVAFLQSSADRFRALLLSWFGGEPLLSVDRLLRIQRAARDAAVSHGTLMASHITTNGLLLDEATARALIESGVRSYQITLDGPPDVHDRQRPRRGGQATFDRIFQNVSLLARQFSEANVKLRVNYYPATLDRIPDLLASFDAEIRPRLDLVLEPIFTSEYGEVRRPDSASSVSPESIYRVAMQMGFKATKSGISETRLTYCYADRKSQVLINFNGDVFKCTVDKFKSSDRLGILGIQGEIVWDSKRLAEWFNVPAFEEKCHQCTYMPMCMGGCRKMRLRAGSIGDDCGKPFEGMKDRIRRHYLNRREATALCTGCSAGSM